MARLHTRKHGKSKSRKPLADAVKIDVDKSKVEEAILNYSKQGMNSAQIGQSVKTDLGAGYLKPVLGKRLSQFLIEKGIKKELPDDIMSLMQKAVGMRKHLAANKRDVYGRIRLMRVESKIWRLSKYYRNTGRLPVEWKYNPEQAALMIKKA
ncbi:30S ribosomal protein S15 [uncultured archaeon]|nr:30S ribosomal protein S15 [uncultured archaeon]